MKSNNVLILSKVALAVAAALVATSSNAFEIRVSGASALRNTVPRLMDRFCKPATGSAVTGATAPRSAYFAESKTTAGTITANRSVYSCTLHDSTSIAAQYPAGATQATGTAILADITSKALAGKQVDFYHSVEPGDATLDPIVGGSITGIIPLMTGSANGLVKFVKKEANTDTAKTLSGTHSTFIGASQYFSSGDITGSTKEALDPHMSLTDVEPAMFTATYGNLPTSQTAIDAGWKLPETESENPEDGEIILTANDPADLTSTVAFLGSMGVAASANLISAGFTNIGEGQLAALLAGQVTNWNQIGGPDLKVRVCRRAPGSGTQATFNQLVSKLGCKANAFGSSYPVADGVPFVKATGSLPNGNGDALIVENATSSDMVNCMIAANTTGTSAGTSIGAIGLLGLESNTTAATWAYLKYNGVMIHDAGEAITDSATFTDSSNLVNQALVRERGNYDGKVDRILEAKIINGQWPLVVGSTAVKSQKIALSTDQTNFYSFIAEKSGDTVFTKELPGIVSLPGKRTTTVNNSALFASNFDRGNGGTCNILIK